MDSTKIKLISFDLWETLISDNYKTNSTKKRNDLRARKLKSLFRYLSNILLDILALILFTTLKNL